MGFFQNVQKFYDNHQTQKNGKEKFRNYIFTQVLNSIFVLIIILIFVLAQLGSGLWSLWQQIIGYQILEYIVLTICLYFIIWRPQWKNAQNKKIIILLLLLIVGIICLTIYITIYFTSYFSILKQSFEKGKDCKVLLSETVQINFQETYSALKVEFTDIEGETQYGYGCVSDLYKSIDFDGIDRFKYYSKNDKIQLDCDLENKKEDDTQITYKYNGNRLLQTTNQEGEGKATEQVKSCYKSYSWSQIKMPSVMCLWVDRNDQLDKQSMEKNLVSNEVRSCYYNIYGNENKAEANSLSTTDFKEKKDFYQVVFYTPSKMFNDLEIDLFLYSFLLFVPSLVFLGQFQFQVLSLPLEICLLKNQIKPDEVKEKQKKYEYTQQQDNKSNPDTNPNNNNNNQVIEIQQKDSIQENNQQLQK